MSLSLELRGSGLRRCGATTGLLAVLLTGCGSDGGAREPPAADTDWRNTAYTVTCDGVAPDGFRATVVDGRARVPADGSSPPYYDHYEVTVVSTAHGDVDGERGAETAVLLECSPQPSNGILQEVVVLSSSGRALGTLPSSSTLQGDALLPPLYDPDGLAMDDGEIVARMLAYGPQDSRADGPSIPFTVRWRLHDGRFVRTSSS
ncbi:hypothetical protein [Blastococcus sp. CCUG 61487]|uniref:hypothetical protein n=1 Tax=Blastococcus sp. CCUG 61487 TaxID=1840703 RepID=UPI0010C047A1|nr:hypothetical protein [Blastococcus sp. CCUG 61487]TKJ31388.1 hypothetical protein A6V29_18320 [Blastococcus sp. CCUG 61487]